MGLMPSGGGNPYTKLDKQSVVGMFKATGATDRDILHAQKEKLLAPPKQLKLLGMIAMGAGVFFTITVVGAILGIPSILFGWWTWRFGASNIEVIESGYSEYTAALGT